MDARMKMTKTVALALFAGALFTACAVDPPPQAAPFPDNASDPLAIPDRHEPPGALETLPSLESAESRLLASIPERGIYLYAMDNGIRLKADTREKDYDWVHGTPREIPPALQIGDYDGDGQEELAILLYSGSGTGISIYDLYIVALEGPGGEILAARHFDKESYLRQLQQAIDFQTRDDDGVLTAEITVGNKATGLDMTSFPLDELGPIYGMPILGNIVHFGADAAGLHASFGVGVAFEKAFSPQYIGMIHADVDFQGHDFQLVNMHFEPYPEFERQQP